MTTRICVKEGQYVEIFVPDSYEGANLLDSDEYVKFRELLVKMIGAEK